MSIHVALHHRTSYAYDRLVGLGPQVIRLRPAPHCRTRILSYSLKLTPSDGHFLNWQQDPFSNHLARVVYPEKIRRFEVEVDLVAEMSVYNPFDFFLEPDAEKFPFAYAPELAADLAPYLRRSELTPRLGALLATVDRSAQRTIDFLVAINQRLWRDLRYVIRLEPGVQTPEETLEKASGSCRDSGWLLVNLLRHCGLAARFVSGYLIQLKADQKSLDGPSGAEQDFTDLHAWCEVYLPGAGWIGLDPTSGLLAGEGHIPLACSPEPSSAAAISGGVDECEVEFGFEMSVRRVHESPRVTLPYTDEQWARIEALGHALDADLQKNDVRLTMGGEPTFVSLDDPDGPEWNFTAASPRKRELSGELIKRLRRRFAPGALLHYGQGKWYPGEPLPRWALAAFWRKDGQPVWHDDTLIADESKNYGHGPTEALQLATALARALGVDPAHLLPGYEDVFYHTWKERRLPSNVTPADSRLDDPLERDRLARIFQAGLGSVVGYALPLKRTWTDGSPRWMSGSWFLRDRETLWLLPGDSPMGLRLPLDSIPWVTEKDRLWHWPQDPSAPLPPLPREFRYPRFPTAAHAGRQGFLRGASAPLASGFGPGQRAQQLDLEPPPVLASCPPAPGESAPWIVRTALCVQPREGRLHVFMPPVATTEDYLDLVAAIESTAGALGLPVIVEGEPPPRDPRIHKLAVTPDPGVIEVNLHPSKTWDELVERTTVLYDEARQTRLGTEKFMLDGRHSGTGGGNHLILGGETPGDSPLLRRPDLLRSLLAYWQNHPSLSWLFSGLFIGPTSQAPRVDEARHDALHELELAFKEMDRQLARGHCPPWLVDRLFRNLLVDASGNTHRSEFSIDKLYSPDGPGGRLGLVELRAFEMPPHARMSLAQQLLLRGLVAKFWRDPYRRDLVRWGTDIHDRWLLPHFCETDFRDVIADLRASGYAFEAGWFAPHFEFRFPRIGDFSARDVHVELRAALEPWHVLGETPGPGGTVRYVDSSLERLQIKARGLIGDRFALAVNGRRIPLHPTGVNGEAVAGIRYRAWQPPECLQPTIGVHAPLAFDLVDTWNDRSLGGCTYHVAHPGGRNYVTFPVNSYEAESRRLARFFRHGHTPGPQPPLPPAAARAEHPFTLDLRDA